LIHEHIIGRSRVLRQDMGISIYGHAGEAFLVFPTSGGRHSEFADRGMVDILRTPIETGALQLFCLDTVNAAGWYNKGRSPARRVRVQALYERYILQEVVPLVRRKNPDATLGALGTSLGGYHAMNLALRHPQLFRRALTLGGAFDIRRFLDGYFDDHALEQNPPDYVPRLQDGPRLDDCRAARLILAVGEHDFLLEENRRFSETLTGRGIPHTLDVWGDGAAHDWPWWQRMAAKHLTG
jgi:esterase/lipase superfamily enzyme